MSIEEALKKIYTENQNREEMIHPFKLYCFLTDYCNSSFEDIEMVKFYKKIMDKVNLIRYVLDYSLDDALKNLNDSYKYVSYIDEYIYKKCVMATLLIKYTEKEILKKEKNPKKTLEHLIPKMNTFLYYTPNSRVYHCAYNCEVLQESKDISFIRNIRNEEIPMCARCKGFTPKKKHLELIHLQRIYNLVHGTKEEEIPIRINGKNLTENEIRKTILKK